MNNHFNKRGRNNNNNHQRRRQGANPNRALDSNGPDVRIRGTAQQIYDKYQALARDATSVGDRVKAENYLQHAEHYFRVLRAAQGPQAQPFDQNGGDSDIDGDQPSIGEGRDGREQRHQGSQFDRDDTDVPESAGMTSPQPAPESVGDAPPKEFQGQEPGKAGGEQEGRRRRRPRRPREEGGSEEPAEDVEPVPAS